MWSAARSSPTTEKIASAAATFIFSVIRRAPASSAPRKTPGKASTLLIWFGKSLRPVATIAAYRLATSGWISGSGFEQANTTPPGVMLAIASSGTLPAESPRNTSAPTSASATPPVRPSGLVLVTSSALMSLRSPRPACTMPFESTIVISASPAVSRMLAHATPAAPAPEMTIFSELISRPSTAVAPRRAASSTIAVPCWSSCMTGQSSASITRRSISKQRGAEMSSKLTAPKLGRSRIRVSTISSGSLVASTIGIESRPPNVLNSAALPSMTGSEANGPISPRPSTALPSLTTATSRCAQV